MVKSEEKREGDTKDLFHACPDLQQPFSPAVKRPGGCWEVPGGGHIGPTTRASYPGGHVAPDHKPTLGKRWSKEFALYRD